MNGLFFPSRPQFNRLNKQPAGRTVTATFVLLLAVSGGPHAHADSTAKASHEKNCPNGYISLNPGDYSRKPQIQCLTGTSWLTVKPGAVFSVSLPGNASTGASWSLRTLPAELLLEDMTHHRAPECTDKTVGCGGDITTLLFRAADKGKGGIKLQYGQPWEKEAWGSHVIDVIVR